MHFSNWLSHLVFDKVMRIISFEHKQRISVIQLVSLARMGGKGVLQIRAKGDGVVRRMGWAGGKGIGVEAVREQETINNT